MGNALATKELVERLVEGDQPIDAALVEAAFSRKRSAVIQRAIKDSCKKDAFLLDEAEAYASDSDEEIVVTMDQRHRRLESFVQLLRGLLRRKKKRK